MANVISLRPGIVERLHDVASATNAEDRADGLLARAVAVMIRRGRASRELRDLSDRYLRDIGLDRASVTDRARPSVAWDAAKATWLHPDASGR